MCVNVVSLQKTLLAVHDINKALTLGVTANMGLTLEIFGMISGPSAKAVSTSKEAFNKGVVDLSAAIELVPRHTYVYLAKTNLQNENEPEDQVDAAEYEIRKLQEEYGLMVSYSSKQILKP
jgi:hypothetical protein